jgi:hypothetical protein
MTTYRTETVATGTLPSGREVEITLTCCQCHITRTAAAGCATLQQAEIVRELPGVTLTFAHTAIAKNGTRYPI